MQWIKGSRVDGYIQKKKLVSHKKSDEGNKKLVPNVLDEIGN